MLAKLLRQSRKAIAATEWSRLIFADGLHVTADYQFVDNPGYNHVRGPVSLFALRLHAEF